MTIHCQQTLISYFIFIFQVRLGKFQCRVGEGDHDFSVHDDKTKMKPKRGCFETSEKSPSLMANTGLITNSILSCWIFTIQSPCETMCLLRTHIQGLCQLFLTVSWDLCSLRDTPDSDLVSLQFQMHRMSPVEGPWRGTMSAHKALQGSQTRGLLEGTEYC